MTHWFSEKYRILGWILAVPASILGILVLAGVGTEDHNFLFPVFAIWNEDIIEESGWFLLTETYILDEVAMILLVAGLVFIGFARRPYEDEMISRCRLEALRWAMMAYAGMVVFGTLFFYSFAFLTFMSIGLVLPLLVFVARFEYLLYRENQLLHD